MHGSETTLKNRDREILRLTVAEYIQTAKPVGSSCLAQKYGQCVPAEAVSSATIRAVFGKLEQLGLLRQPHKSAGRIPTEKGYRLFIHELMHVEEVSLQDRQILTQTFAQMRTPMESIRETSKYLAECTKQIGLITSPKLEDTIFRQIQFVRIGTDKILAVFIADNGMIEQRIVNWQDTPSQDDLWNMANYLNDLLANATLREVRQRLQAELLHEKTRYDALKKQALELRHTFLEEPHDQVQIFVEGQSQIMEQPEFAQGANLKHLFSALEQKGNLVKMLEKVVASSQNSASIILGKDIDSKDFGDLAFVARSYGTPDNPLGTLAIAGPTRMDYWRIVPIVNFTAEKLNDLFQPQMNE